MQNLEQNRHLYCRRVQNRVESGIAGKRQSCYGEVTMAIARPMNPAVEATARSASSETALVGELTAGSEQAFAYLLAIYQNPVFNFVTHVLGNEADAADVVQNVFVKVFRGIKHFHEESTLKTWIYRIAVHEALNHRRSWLRRLFHEPVSMDDPETGGALAMHHADRSLAAPDRLLEQAETQELVRRALMSIPPPYRLILVLREIEDLSYEEVAAVTGLAEGTVKSRLRRGRDLLRRKLEGHSGVSS